MDALRAPDVESLRLLREVARSGSIAAAAQTNGRSQQALSARIRTLESALGTRVLDRGHGGSTLTPNGILILEWAEDVLAAADRFDAAIRSLDARTGPRLRVAASQTIAENLLPGWLVQLRQIEEDAAAAHTTVELDVGNSTAVIESVRSNACDVGFIETTRLPEDLFTQTVRIDELVVVVAPSHGWARRRSPLPLTQLAATPLVMREVGSGTRDSFADILAAQDTPVQARPKAVLGTTAAVRSAIAAGIGPGVLSRLAVRDDLVLGRLVTVEVDAPPLLRPLSIVQKSALRRASAGADRLLSVARREQQ